MPDIRHFDEARVVERAELLFWREGVRAVGVAQLSDTTGLSRSSLYNAFGDKHGLYLAAVDRYLSQRALPAFADLESSPEGLTATKRFFDQLITARCSGPHRGWGCLIVNSSIELADSDPEAAKRFATHARALCTAFAAALERARALREIHPDTDVTAHAHLLMLLAYGLTVRSRAGAHQRDLQAAVHAALTPISTQPIDRRRRNA